MHHVRHGAGSHRPKHHVVMVRLDVQVGTRAPASRRVLRALTGGPRRRWGDDATRSFEIVVRVQRSLWRGGWRSSTLAAPVAAHAGAAVDPLFKGELGPAPCADHIGVVLGQTLPALRRRPVLSELRWQTNLCSDGRGGWLWRRGWRSCARAAVVTFLAGAALDPVVARVVKTDIPALLSELTLGHARPNEGVQGLLPKFAASSQQSQTKRLKETAVQISVSYSVVQLSAVSSLSSTLEGRHGSRRQSVGRVSAHMADHLAVSSGWLGVCVCVCVCLGSYDLGSDCRQIVY